MTAWQNFFPINRSRAAATTVRTYYESTTTTNTNSSTNWTQEVYLPNGI